MPGADNLCVFGSLSFGPNPYHPANFSENGSSFYLVTRKVKIYVDRKYVVFAFVVSSEPESWYSESKFIFRTSWIYPPNSWAYVIFSSWSSPCISNSILSEWYECPFNFMFFTVVNLHFEHYLLRFFSK